MNNRCATVGFFSTAGAFRLRSYAPPGFVYNPIDWYNRSQGSGIGYVRHTWLQGVESSNETNCTFYTIEHTDWRVDKFQMNVGSTTLQATGVSWGGTQTDGMGGFYNPRDITRDDQNDYYILDLLSTSEPLVKKYGSTGAQIGSFGDSSSIDGDPLRIEGSDYDGNIFVLHYDSGSGDTMISIFEPGDM